MKTSAKGDSSKCASIFYVANDGGRRNVRKGFIMST